MTAIFSAGVNGYGLATDKPHAIIPVPPEVNDFIKMCDGKGFIGASAHRSLEKNLGMAKEGIMFKLIIVALDGSEHSLKALDYARELAQKFDSKLILLHAFHPTSDLRGSEGFNQMVGRRKQKGEKIIENACGRLGRVSIEVEENLLEGPAAEAIVSVVEARKADLVVMGTRGMGSLKGMLFGSVSTKVTHYASCPVLVVR